MSVAAADLTGDARPELVAMRGGYPVVPLLNSGTGAYPGATRSGTVANVNAMAAGDVNGDGRVDLVVVPATSGGTTVAAPVLLGSGNGAYGGSTTLSLRGDELAIGDLNGDANADLVTLVESSTSPAAEIRLPRWAPRRFCPPPPSRRRWRSATSRATPPTTPWSEPPRA
ncbi:MAG: VCBS repeat-containing protein [Myxococcota bacterium]|jgi:hypothetical protein